jgi:outer membrane protein assembly factor BamE (lipoprotein component of BamABCDE complex)
MSVVKRKHFKILYIIFTYIFISYCQLSPVSKTHGINFLENRAKLLTIDVSNKNDVVSNIGTPHTKSIKNDNVWVYFERKIERGKMLKLGKNVTKKNNVLVLQFDKYGVLEAKDFYDINSMNKVAYSKQGTENIVQKNSFVREFLSSLRQKMYQGRTK